MTDFTPYAQGVRSGRNVAKEWRAKGIVALDRDGHAHDVVGLAAMPFVPDEVVAAIAEKVPVEVRGEYNNGFQDGVRAFTAEHELGLGEN